MLFKHNNRKIVPIIAQCRQLKQRRMGREKQRNWLKWTIFHNQILKLRGKKLKTNKKEKGENWEMCTDKDSKANEMKWTSHSLIQQSSSNQIPSTVSFHFHSIMQSQAAPRGTRPHWCEHAGHRLSVKMSQMAAWWEATGFWNKSFWCHCCWLLC